MSSRTRSKTGQSVNLILERARRAEMDDRERIRQEELDRRDQIRRDDHASSTRGTMENGERYDAAEFCEVISDGE